MVTKKAQSTAQTNAKKGFREEIINKTIAELNDIGQSAMTVEQYCQEGNGKSEEWFVDYDEDIQKVRIESVFQDVYMLISADDIEIHNDTGYDLDNFSSRDSAVLETLEYINDMVKMTNELYPIQEMIKNA